MNNKDTMKIQKIMRNPDETDPCVLKEVVLLLSQEMQ
ncbi:hypothetical protein VSVS05_00518 [Vibrio scophthalmi]|uniref:Uncharacterized protein n=1 Tax=Vibrio scophthalmi TaxID=45658 RepID=A0A1C7F6V7_9VIBR|nr:hypothetical protein VSVS05_00518 [Vibrio scophthalmi]